MDLNAESIVAWIAHPTLNIGGFLFGMSLYFTQLLPLTLIFQVVAMRLDGACVWKR